MQHLQYFWKRIFLKIIFGITVKCVAILLIFIVTDEKLILYINTSSSLKTMYKKPKILNEAIIETISSF